MRFAKLNQARGQKLIPILILALAVAAVMAMVVLLSGEARGDPPQHGTWYIEGDEQYSDVTFTINGDLQINSTASLSLDNVTLIFNNTRDREFTLRILGDLSLNSSTVRSVNASYRMGTTDITGSVECSHSLLRDFADFRLQAGADFFANDTTISHGRRLFVTTNDLGIVLLENSTIGSTGNPSNIIVNDEIVFRDVTFPASEVSVGQNGRLVVQYFLSVRVETEAGDPVPGADVGITSESSEYDFETDTSGRVRYIPLTRYIRTADGTDYDEDYTVTVSAGGYSRETIEVRMNRTRSLTFTLTPLPDPHVGDDDIDFLPADPNEGDMVAINISLHNTGVDADVRVLTYIEDPRGDRTPIDTSELTLKEGITGYVEAVWNTTDGKAGTYRIIAVIQNITADLNLSNNEAERQITLFARPIVTRVAADLTDVFRLTPASMAVNGEDIETSEENLTLQAQSRPSSGGQWTNTAFSAPWWNGSAWIVNFTPPASAALGYHDLRFRFIDENNGTSDWFPRLKLIFVRNNPPEITSVIPDQELPEDTDLVLDLRPYMDDAEDGNETLRWYVGSHDPDSIMRITGQNGTEDRLTFTPHANWTGTTEILLVLEDRDGDTASQWIDITWTFVNDPPRLVNITFSTQKVPRTSSMVLFINATDDNSTEESLILAVQFRHEDATNWTDQGFDITTEYITTDPPEDSHWKVTIVPAANTVPGIYNLRFNITDDDPDTPEASRYYIHEVEVLNNPPEILDISADADSVLRTGTVVFTIKGIDIEDHERDLIPAFQFRYRLYPWEDIDNAWYDGSAGLWTFNFTPAATDGIGNYTFRARFTDTDGGMTDWIDHTIVVLNNPPEVVNLSLSVSRITVNSTFTVHANGSDVEDMEGELQPLLEFSLDHLDPDTWSDAYVRSASYINGTWVMEVHFPEDAPLGSYSVRLRFTDRDGDHSDPPHEVQDALNVVNNVPVVLDMGIPATVPRTTTATLWAEAECDLDEEDSLTHQFQYFHLDQWWGEGDPGSFLGLATYSQVNGRWEIGFTPDHRDTSLGNYSFRVRFQLRLSDLSPWFHLQNGTTVVNSLPRVLGLAFNGTQVFRGDDLTVNVTVEDAEDDLSDLGVTLEYSLGGTLWRTAYLSPLTRDGDVLVATFSPPLTAALGNYTFRARVTDMDGGMSPWFTAPSTVRVRNNPPRVVESGIPETQEQEDNPLALRLTPYGTDREDEARDLDWKLMEYDDTVIVDYTHDVNYDLFTFWPAENFTGYTTVRFRLTDRAGDFVEANASLFWRSVNDPPVIFDLACHQTAVLRDGILTIHINATDDDDDNADLTPIIMYSLDGITWITAAVDLPPHILGHPSNGTIVANHSVPKTLTPGNYTVRVRVRDTSGEDRTRDSKWHYLPDTIEVRNNLPEVLDILLFDDEAHRTEVVPVLVDARDVEDDLPNLTAVLAYSYDHNETDGSGNWTVGYFGSVTYNDTLGQLVIEFIPGRNAGLGIIFIRVAVVDRDGGMSLNWSEVRNLTLLNNEPEIEEVPEPSVPEDTVLVLDMIPYGSDAEDDPEDLRWFVIWYNDTVIVDLAGNGTTELSFTPRDNFTGETNITLMLMDRDDANVTINATLFWESIPEPPRVIGYVLAESFVYRGDTLDIAVEVEDDDDDVEDLVATLEYLPPGGVWTGLPMTHDPGNDTWIAEFTPGDAWVTGVYTFRVRFRDSDELENHWVMIDIRVLSIPAVESFDGPAEVYRTHTVTLYVNGSDGNDDEEWELTPHFGYSRNNFTFFSDGFSQPVYGGGIWTVDFTPGAGLVTGLYHLRVRFNDTDGAYSPWSHRTIQMMNNPPTITSVIPDNTAPEDHPIVLSLKDYGSDVEDSPDRLQWTAEWDHGIAEVLGTGTVNLTFIPILDFFGDSLVLLTVSDRDGASESQYVTLTWTPINDPPRVSRLELRSDTTDPQGNYIFNTGSNLSTVLHDLMDPEGDPISVTYSWLVNDEYVVENSTDQVGLTGDHFQRGDVVTIRIILSDGTDTGWFENITLISNAPPTITGVTVTILFNGDVVDRANVSSVLRATYHGYADLDGDPANHDMFLYEWYNRGALIASGTGLDEINGTMFRKGFDVYCRILPHDGFEHGIGARSDSVPIYNSPPAIENITVFYTGGEPGGPNRLSTLRLNLSGYRDPDNDLPDLGRFMYHWYVNGESTGVTTFTLDSSHFGKGDMVYCLVTPHDGSVPGMPVASETITIRNTPPTMVGAALNNTGSRPDRHSTLSLNMSGYQDLDGDSPDLGKFIYEWFVNGVSVSTGPTLDLASYNRTWEVHCVVTPHDGEDAGAPVTTRSLTIQNAPPVLEGVTVTITYNGEVVTTANLSSVLTAAGEGYSDADGDPEQASRFTWFINNLSVKTGISIDNTYFRKGDRVHCVVEPYDGITYGEGVRTREILIGNTPPELNEARVIALGPPTRVATVTVEIIGYFDADNDPQGVHRYEWFVNDIPVPGQHNATLRNSHLHTFFTKSDVITVRVTPFDGSDHGAPVMSSNGITIINTPPMLTAATIEWTGELNATTTLSVNARPFYSDPDGDPEANFYYQWFVNSPEIGFPVLVHTAFNDPTLTGMFRSRDRVFCMVTPNDGEDNGTAVFTPSVLIQNSPPEIYGQAVITSNIIPANKNAVLSVITTGLRTADIDGDPTTYRFRWYVNGVPAGAPEVNTLGGIYFNKGDRIHCQVHAYDGGLTSQGFVRSDDMIIGNTPPVARIHRPVNNSFADVYESVRLDASSSFDPDATDTLTYLWFVEGVEVGTEMTASVLMTPGDHVVVLQVSDGEALDETRAVIRVRAPDLYVSPDRIIFSGTLYAGRTATIVANIGNIGTADARNVTVAFFVDGTRLGTVRDLSVAAGNNETVSISWKAVEGTHTVRVVIDEANEVPEFDITNNEALRTVVIVMEPEKEDDRFGIGEEYLNMIMGLAILVAILMVANLVRWKRAGSRSKNGT